MQEGQFDLRNLGGTNSEDVFFAEILKHTCTFVLQYPIAEDRLDPPPLSPSLKLVNMR